jgi:PAS domain S-box-containing protein
MNIIRVNPAMEFWYVHSLPLLGKKCYEAYHERKERCDPCPTYRTLQTGNVAYEVVPKTGPGGAVTGWLDLYTFPLFDPQTQTILGAIEYVRDITDRKMAEEVLHRSERTFRALLNATDDAMFLIDTKGIFLALNDTLANRLSKKTEDLLGKCAFDILPPEIAALRKNWVKHVIQTGESIRFEDKRDGVWLENMIYPIIDKTGSVTMLAICSRNITDHKYSEQERENLIERLREYIAKIKTLSGLIPICSSCKKVRGDEGYWSQLEIYISEHSDAEFSHGICPECAKKLYPDY